MKCIMMGKFVGRWDCFASCVPCGPQSSPRASSAQSGDSPQFPGQADARSALLQRLGLQGQDELHLIGTAGKV